MKGLLGALAALPEEIRRIGPRAFAHRVARELENRTGLYRVRLSPRRRASVLPDDAVERWRREPGRFFLDGLEHVRRFLDTLDDDERSSVEEVGRRAARGTIRAFDAWEADFGHPPDWTLDPRTGGRWPAEAHSRRVARQRPSPGSDIKHTWEIGRFNHAPAVLRAYAVSGDATLVDALFEQLASFEEQNPMHAGPHWISEQEVAIRGAQLTLVLHALGQELSDARVALLLRQIASSAVYCAAEIDFAERCIRNNHLIAGAMGLYLPGTLLPWHPDAAEWRRRGRALLVEAVAEQWYDDGGYVQPSHNYHRLALSYLLWVLRVADLNGDEALARRIQSVFGPARRLLSSMMEPGSGHLPNWGPNDGALFFPLAVAEYRDFRPLLTALSFAETGARGFDAGPHDEGLYWLWGSEAANAEASVTKPGSESFPDAGLHALRGDDGFAVLRCGSIRSRYGQQADQLHVDLWWRGVNILRDAGSYSYAESAQHEWFRSTDAHNTVVVGGESQMTPHRQFLFLGWPEAGLIQLPEPPEGVRAWVAGWHGGYRRLNRRVDHHRLLALLEQGGWLVVDRLVAGPGEPMDFDLRWHVAPCGLTLGDDVVHMAYEVGGFAMHWASNRTLTVDTRRGSDDPVDGWHASGYGVREAAPALRLRGVLESSPVTVATTLGPIESAMPCELDGNDVRVGAVVLPLAELSLDAVGGA